MNKFFLCFLCFYYFNSYCQINKDSLFTISNTLNRTLDKSSLFTNFYDDKNLVRYSFYLLDNKLAQNIFGESMIIYDYDNLNRLIQVTIFDSAGNYHTGDYGAIIKTNYHNNSKTESYFDASKVLLNSIEFQYDSLGREIKSLDYDRNNILIKYKTIKYNDNFNEAITCFYNINGIVTNACGVACISNIYTNNTFKNLIEKRFYDANLQEIDCEHEDEDFKFSIIRYQNDKILYFNKKRKLVNSLTLPNTATQHHK